MTKHVGVGVWLSLARAPGLGPGGRRFESCYPDFFILFVFHLIITNISDIISCADLISVGCVFVAQLDRATAF